jgi:hypothetical protein
MKRKGTISLPEYRVQGSTAIRVETLSVSMFMCHSIMLQKLIKSKLTSQQELAIWQPA